MVEASVPGTPPPVLDRDATPLRPGPVIVTADGRASSLTEALDTVVPESDGEQGYDCCS